MAHYVTSIRSPQPASEAFEFLADLRNFERWDPGVKSSVQVVGEGAGLGAEYDVAVTGSLLRYRVEEYEPPLRLLAVAVTKRLTSRDLVTVTADGDSSVCTYDATLTLNGALRAVDPLLAVMFRRLGDRAARGLAEALEGRIVGGPA